MLEELKERVLFVARQAQREGLCRHKSGNFSMRDETSGLLVVTPSGVDREQLKIDDMIVMNMDAEVLENKTGLKPTSEALMHIRIYQERDDVHAIAHTHSMYATVFAVLNKPIPALVYEMQNLACKNGYVPVAPYGRPGTPTLAESIVRACKEADAFLLKGHGGVAVDSSSIEEAYLKACYLEELAELYHHVLAIHDGKEPEHFPPEELQKWAYPSEIKFPNQGENK